MLLHNSFLLFIDNGLWNRMGIIIAVAVSIIFIIDHLFAKKHRRSAPSPVDIDIISDFPRESLLVKTAIPGAITRQNFNLVIGFSLLFLLSIIFTAIAYYFDPDYEPSINRIVLEVAYYVLELVILVAFRKYLRNFVVPKVIKSVGILIFLVAISGLLGLTYELIEFQRGTDEEESDSLISLIFLFYFLHAFWQIIVGFYLVKLKSIYFQKLRWAGFSMLTLGFYFFAVMIVFILIYIIFMESFDEDKFSDNFDTFIFYSLSALAFVYGTALMLVFIDAKKKYAAQFTEKEIDGQLTS